MVPPAYDRDIEKILRRCDPCGDLDSAHIAWIELASQPVGDHIGIPALVDRAKKRGLDERRRQKRRSPEYLQMRAKQSEPPRPEAAVIRTETQDRVREAVSRLPSGYRMPIALHFFEDLSVTEIAAQLRLPEKTIYTQLERGKARLAADDRLVAFAG